METSIAVLYKGWSGLHPLCLSNLQKSPFYGNASFYISVSDTPEASSRFWGAVLLLAVHAGSKSEP